MRNRPDRGGTGHRRYGPVGTALGHQRRHQLGPCREALGPYLADHRAGDPLDHQRPGWAGVGGQQPAVGTHRGVQHPAGAVAGLGDPADLGEQDLGGGLVRGDAYGIWVDRTGQPRDQPVMLVVGRSGLGLPTTQPVHDAWEYERARDQHQRHRGCRLSHVSVAEQAPSLGLPEFREGEPVTVTHGLITITTRVQDHMAHVTLRISGHALAPDETWQSLGQYPYRPVHTGHMVVSETATGGAWASGLRLDPSSVYIVHIYAKGRTDSRERWQAAMDRGEYGTRERFEEYLAVFVPTGRQQPPTAPSRVASRSMRQADVPRTGPICPGS